MQIDHCSHFCWVRHGRKNRKEVGIYSLVAFISSWSMRTIWLPVWWLMHNYLVKEQQEQLLLVWFLVHIMDFRLCKLFAIVAMLLTRHWNSCGNFLSSDPASSCLPTTKHHSLPCPHGWRENSLRWCVSTPYLQPCHVVVPTNMIILHVGDQKAWRSDVVTSLKY